MQALICMIQVPSKTYPSLIGWGHTERLARLNAFARCHQGYNPYDEEYQGGILIPVSKRLEEVNRRGCGPDSHVSIYNQKGELVGGHFTELHHDLLRALGRLCIRNGELDYE
ncbi:hypothetical protein HA052_19865 [Chromobacterium haemolyticum]|uniref:Uncharacterized protein n=1 Tax=Chromobacterium fluminis TaxID=3044269 RepID=A0ABX0LD53_9NEIS|nr:hypothetical protein [Chromobacterium haemolyticum]NHR07452.1 hypothetical protein [Chromobacterium haemolyticum]